MANVNWPVDEFTFAVIELDDFEFDIFAVDKAEFGRCEFGLFDGENIELDKSDSAIWGVILHID